MSRLSIAPASMAHSFRQPLSRSLGISPSISRRCFSQVPARRAILGSQQPARAREAPQPSMYKQRTASAVLTSNVDVGILPETFIYPSRKNLPSLFGTPLQFLKFQWRRLLFNSRGYLGLIGLKYTSPREKSFLRRRVKIFTSKVTPTAVALHRQMYTAAAEGDVLTLRKICVDGIYNSFASRIASRQKREKVVWELVKYNGSPKLMSHVAAIMPKAMAGEGSAVRQAVVRIKSRQKLTRYVPGPNGSLVVAPGSGKEKDLVEYVVMQMIYQHWKENPWMVWGTTRETTLDDVKEWDRKKLASK